MITGMAAAAAVASLAGGVVAARRPPSTLFSSISLGLAGGETERYHRRHRPWGDEVSVLAGGGTAARWTT